MKLLFRLVVLSLHVLLASATVEVSLPTAEVVCEGDTAQLPVLATGTATGPVTVTIGVNARSAQQPADFQLPSPAAMLTFSVEDMANGHAVKYLPITTSADGISESSEFTLLEITGNTGDSTVGSPNSTSLNIYDVAMYPEGLITVKGAYYSVQEDAGTVTVTLERICNLNPVDGALVSLAEITDCDSCSATGGANFLAHDPVGFAPGQYQEFEYTIVDTNLQTGSVAFQFRANNIEGGVGHADQFRKALVFIDAVPAAATQDPHVLLRVHGLDLPVCFDLFGEVGRMLILIKGAGYKVLGNFIGDGYFGAIDILTIEQDIKITTESVSVGRTEKAWNGTGTATMRHVDFVDTNKLRVSVEEDCVMTVERAENENAGAYLNFFVDEIKHKKAGGIMGAMLTTDYKLKDINGIATLISINGVATAVKKTMFGNECWFVDEQGKNLYPGERADYDA